MSVYFATGKKHIHEFHIEQKYLDFCTQMRNKYGEPFFDMPWPNKKIFMVFRDRQDNEYEVRYIPLTMAYIIEKKMESNP